MATSFDFKSLAEQIGKEMFPSIMEDFKKRFKETLKNIITPYFMTRSDRQHFKDNPHLLHRFGITKDNINDIGVVDDIINDQVSGLILSEETKNYIKNQIDREFKKHLDDALELVMKHHAKRAAFTIVENTVKK